MSNTNNKIPTLSLNKSDICSNTEHPITSQELNPSSQNIPQTRCAISLINRPQPCCCRDFSTALLLPQFFCCTFSAAIFLPHFFCHDFFFRDFFSHFFCDFSAALFSINNTYPNNFSQNRYSMIFNRFKCD
jgi:hypothetical protein